MENKITIDKLEGASNWTDWKLQVTIQLEVTECMEAVTGELKAPVLSADADESQRKQHDKNFRAYKKKEYQAQSLIVSTVTTEVRQLINMCSSSKEMWEKLCGVYEQRSQQRQDRLFNELFGFRKDPNDSIAAHVSKLQRIWQELSDETWKEDQVKLPDSLLLNRVLNTLSLEYFEFQNAWESVPKSERTLDSLVERLRIVEDRLKVRNKGDEMLEKNGTALLSSNKEGRHAGMNLKKKKNVNSLSNIKVSSVIKKVILLGIVLRNPSLMLKLALDRHCWEARNAHMMCRIAG